MKKVCAVFLAVVFLPLMGCGVHRYAKWDEGIKGPQFASSESKQAKQLEAAGDEYFAKRYDQTSLRQALEKWDQAVALAPSSELFVKLARGHFLMADGFYALDEQIELRDKHFTKGLDYAEKALSASAPEVVAAVKNGAKFFEAVKSAPMAAVPSLYWYAANLGKWAAAQGFVTRLRYKDDIKATMDRVMQLAPQYFYAGPWRYFGAYEAITAGIAGGDLNKSKSNFEKAVQLAPDYLGTKVVWAEYLCTKTQDKDMFLKLVNEVIQADPGVNPSIEPENRIEQKKAKKLLAQVDENF